jgi:hypothetical protein
MIFEVRYRQPKKKGFSNQVATFLKLDDAFFWESHIKNNGAKDIIICPK